MRVLSSFAPFLAVIPILVVACSGGDDGKSGTEGTGAGDTGSGLPCEVEAVLQKDCRSCHGSSPQFGAPNPLVTHADLHAAGRSDPSKKVYELVSDRVHDTARPMPPPPASPLGEESLRLLDDWIARGAPAGSTSCEPSGEGGSGNLPTLNCTPDITIQAEAPYVMPKEVEDVYMCYGVDVEIGEKRQIIAHAPRVDNTTIVHHMLLFAADAAYPKTPQVCNGGNMGRLMGVWAPGGQALELPPEAGFAIEGTAHFVVQVHYSNLMGLDGEQDRSGYSLCTTDQLRPNDADVMAFGTNKIAVPPNGSQDVTCDLTIPALFPQITTISGMPHMHKIGTHISTTLLPADGRSPVDLGTSDPWDFDLQEWTDVRTTLGPGDLVRARCAWNNPTPYQVNFGEGTSDEMCFGFVMYYPRITAPQWVWGAPAFLSTCSPTP
ncbi:peptidylglycine alpha-amidating monooxygenase [Chondromyces crocatus]|uniref:Peptidylglycine alpha-amidating monooxygenase n=1 Tax=Chondromyces crocatus TaxID=52 RepID=A0A0K1EI15_CHOCO|nr:peptidylglycine alpha-amidating monooxygenase [Chondromyces crocatus]AKT40499.1 peptidylglycine alpha-amidating monooxygenase [Chondromyces crocatus]